MIEPITTQQIVNRFTFTNASKDELWISKDSYDKERKEFLECLISRIKHTLGKEDYSTTRGSLNLMLWNYEKELEKLK